jgi:hypothetical protein
MKLNQVLLFLIIFFHLTKINAYYQAIEIRTTTTAKTKALKLFLLPKLVNTGRELPVGLVVALALVELALLVSSALTYLILKISPEESLETYNLPQLSNANPTGLVQPSGQELGPPLSTCGMYNKSLYPF